MQALSQLSYSPRGRLQGYYMAVGYAHAVNGPDARHLVFTGFMGAGKSTLASLTAVRLGRVAYDSDELIVQRTGRSIVEMFEAGEEPWFRREEAEVIAELLDAEPPAVIALGGGALDNPETLARVTGQAVLVNLEISWAEIQSELPKLKSSRPLLRDRSEREIQALFERRQDVYRQARLSVPVDRRDPNVTTARVLAALATLSPAE
jgi:shikimate kinase